MFDVHLFSSFIPMKKRKSNGVAQEMILIFVIRLLEIEDLLDPIHFCPFAPLVTINSVTRYKNGLFSPAVLHQ